MKLIIKTFFLSLIFFSFVNAGENFSEMSTQELIAIMGYVKPSARKTFQRELKARVNSMTTNEKVKYEKNLHKLK